jgi:predicted transcriptional regulator
MMQSHTDSLEQIDNKLQQSSRVFDDPIACYMESFNNQNLQLMISCKYENKNDDQMVSESAMSFILATVLLQEFYADFQSFHDISKLYLYESKNADERVDSQHINHLE